MMTDQQISEYYSGLLIMQYSQKPKAIATVQALALSLFSGQVFSAIQNAYTIATAVGVQLDVLGKYAGVVRQGQTPSGPVILGDPDFRILIQIAAIRNSSDGTFAGLQNTIAQFFAGSLYVYDYKTMRISYIINSNSLSDQLIDVALSQGVFPKNMGVSIGSVISVDTPTTLFGFCTYDTAPVYLIEYGKANYNNSPFNTYDSYNLNYPWLTYDSSISIPPSFLTDEDGNIIDTESGEGISL